MADMGFRDAVGPTQDHSLSIGSECIRLPRDEIGDPLQVEHSKMLRETIICAGQHLQFYGARLASVARLRTLVTGPFQSSGFVHATPTPGMRVCIWALVRAAVTAAFA